MNKEQEVDDIRSLLGENNKYRLHAAIRSGDVNEDERTVAVTFSSEEPVKRTFGMEILDHNPANVDLSRLLDGAPVLEDHRGGVIGVVEDATVKDNKGFALLRFSDNPGPQEVFNDIVKGIRKNISVGYELTNIVDEVKSDDGEKVVRFAFKPYEISVVGVPADNTIGVGRSYEEIDSAKTEENTEDERELEAVNEAVEVVENVERIKPKMEAIKMSEEIDNKAQDEAVAKAARKATTEVSEMYHVGSVAGFDADKVRGMIAEGADLSSMKTAAIDALRSVERSVETKSAEDNIPAEAKRAYDLGGVIRSMVSRRPVEGLEREVSQEISKRSGVESAGTMVPYFAFTGERVLEAGSSPGSNLVGTDHRGDLFIEKLNNRAKVMSLGAQSLTGLQGNVAIPRQTGAVTIASLAETASITPSDSNYDQVTLSPKRIGGQTIFSKQLLMQGDPSIENLVRNDIMEQIMLDIDAKSLQGSGAANQPTGIENQSGINTVTFTSAATWAKVLEFETAVATDNADVDAMAYLTTAAVRGAWKGIEKASSTGIYLWQENSSPVNGYNAQVSNQIAGNLVFFGDWSQLLLGFWGGIDLIVDDITNAGDAEVILTGNAFFDVAVRHPEAFAVSTDAGNI